MALGHPEGYTSFLLQDYPPERLFFTVTEESFTMGTALLINDRRMYRNRNTVKDDLLQANSEQF